MEKFSSRSRMEESDLLKKRLHAITEKRRVQDDIRQMKQELDREKLKLQHLKKKALKEQWLLEDSTSHNSPQQQQSLLADQQQARTLQSNIYRIEKEVESLEREESRISTNESFILKRLKAVEKSSEDIIKEVQENFVPEPIKVTTVIPDYPESFTPPANTHNKLELPKQTVIAMEINVAKNLVTGESKVVSTATVTPQELRHHGGVKVYDDGRKCVYTLETQQGLHDQGGVAELSPREVEQLLRDATQLRHGEQHNPSRREGHRHGNHQVQAPGGEGYRHENHQVQAPGGEGYRHENHQVQAPGGEGYRHGNHQVQAPGGEGYRHENHQVQAPGGEGYRHGNHQVQAPGGEGHRHGNHQVQAPGGEGYRHGNHQVQAPGGEGYRHENHQVQAPGGEGYRHGNHQVQAPGGEGHRHGNHQVQAPGGEGYRHGNHQVQAPGGEGYRHENHQVQAPGGEGHRHGNHQQRKRDYSSHHGNQEPHYNSHNNHVERYRHGNYQEGYHHGDYRYHQERNCYSNQGEGYHHGNHQASDIIRSSSRRSQGSKANGCPPPRSHDQEVASAYRPELCYTPANHIPLSDYISVEEEELYLYSPPRYHYQSEQSHQGHSQSESQALFYGPGQSDRGPSPLYGANAPYTILSAMETTEPITAVFLGFQTTEDDDGRGQEYQGSIKAELVVITDDNDDDVRKEEKSHTQFGNHGYPAGQSANGNTGQMDAVRGQTDRWTGPADQMKRRV